MSNRYSVFVSNANDFEDPPVTESYADSWTFAGWAATRREAWALSSRLLENHRLVQVFKGLGLDGKIGQQKQTETIQ